MGDISKLLFPQQQNELAVELLSMLQNSTIDLMFVLGTNRNQLICKMTARLRVEATLNPSLGNQRKAEREKWHCNKHPYHQLLLVFNNLEWWTFFLCDCLYFLYVIWCTDSVLQCWSMAICHNGIMCSLRHTCWNEFHHRHHCNSNHLWPICVIQLTL